MTDPAEIARAQAKIREWKRNPAKQVYDLYGITPDKWQEQALLAFASKDPTKQRIAMKACVGPGKTFVEAACGWNFLSCYGEPGEHPKGAAISITKENLGGNLWPEFAKLRNRSPFLQSAFEWTNSRIFAKEHPETWFLEARSWPKKANPEEQGRTLSGLHSKYVLAIIDESGGIPPQVLRAAEQMLSTGPKFGKILQGGNPIDPAGMLYESAVRLPHLWHVITVTGDPDDPDRSPRVSIDWAREQIKAYGRDNPWVMAHILGKFPPTGINSLIGPEEVEEAMKRCPREDDYNWSQKRLGIDAARFGDDPWVIFPRQGIAAFTPIERRNPTTEEIVACIMTKKHEWGSEMEFVDGTGGYGGGCIDGLRLAKCKNVVEVQYSSKAGSQRFFNKRSEMLWLCAEWAQKKGALPRIPQLTREMTAATYWYEAGKLRVAEKDQIKKLLSGQSPNYFDALANTFALPDAPSATGSMAERLARIAQLNKRRKFCTGSGPDSDYSPIPK